MSNVKVDELMNENVIVTEPHHTVEHVRKILEANHIHAVPVINNDQEPVGMVSSADLAKPGLKPGQHISGLMSEKVYSVPRYEGAHIAARVMRNHKLHHLVVTHEKKVVGILSSFDLLKLVEEHRWVPKNAPTKKARNKGNARA